MPESTKTRDTSDPLDAEVAGLMVEAHRLGKRIAAGETVPQEEMAAYYVRRAALDERLDDRRLR